ncbi:hypothetical protein ElyMa_000252200 [Elysia marginata]|uniref:Secreted protein n=1 Tax=Elysia marginata TaxID=1093978 RepID=A0AAV4F345_9GAST|nr:hypothetical protein ElyMa_000252200 [Elysia marginata]
MVRVSSRVLVLRSPVLQVLLTCPRHRNSMSDARTKTKVDITCAGSPISDTVITTHLHPDCKLRRMYTTFSVGTASALGI